MSAGRRRALVTVALAVLIIAIPIAVYALGRESTAFHVRHIVLSGQRRAHTHPLRQALSSAFLGANLFSIDTRRVRDALAKFPYVDGVRVDRRFPDTLRVRLTEFVPAALLFSRGRWYVLSNEGRILAQDRESATTPSPGSSAPAESASPGSAGASPPPSPGAMASPGPASATHPPAAPSPPGPEVELPAGARRLPVIAADLPVAVGGTVTDPRVRDSLAALSALPSRLRRAATSASATATNIRLVLHAGPVLEVGDTSNLHIKMLALRAVLGRYAARHIACTFIDVSVPDRPLAAPLLPAPTTTGHTSAQSP